MTDYTANFICPDSLLLSDKAGEAPCATNDLGDTVYFSVVIVCVCQVQ